jgi:hypothetical protein
MASTQGLALDVLREASEPLSVAEIVRRIAQRQPIESAKPENTVRNALQNQPLCVSAGRNSYVYLPRVLDGSVFRLPVRIAGEDAQRGLLAGPEIAHPVHTLPLYLPERPATRIALSGGPEVVVPAVPFVAGEAPLFMPLTFWVWLDAQPPTHRHTLLFRSLDCEAGRYALEAVRIEGFDPEVVAERNRQVLAAVRDSLKGPWGMRPFDLVLRLIARGVYRELPPPEPLATLLFEVDGRFVHDRGRVSFRPDLTPVLRRVLADRLAEIQTFEDPYLFDDDEEDDRPGFEESPYAPDSDVARYQMPLPMFGDDPAEPPTVSTVPESKRNTPVQEAGDVPAEPPAVSTIPEPGPPTRTLRLKVTLQWRPDVWRTIDILDNQTLEDLHYAIQDAFHWDNDHLYSFFLSGKAWDSITEIATPDSDSEPPLADEVIFRDLDLQPGQEFLYLFDYGDELRHTVEVEQLFPEVKKGDFPRIVQRKGRAPAQYRTWDD